MKKKFTKSKTRAAKTRTTRISRKPNAYVIMPFSGPNTEEHEHFCKVFNSAIVPVIQDSGFSLTRAESLPGNSINNQVNTHLLRDELVVVSLSRLNPSVFSKLSIREKLPGKLTILLIDDDIDPSPRFNITRFPAIRYSLKDDHFRDLRSSLATQISQSQKPTTADSHLVSFLKSINKPIDISPQIDPETELRKAIVESYNDRDPIRLIKKAEEAISSNPPDINTFLVDCVQEFIRLESFIPTDRQYLEMEYLAKRVGLEGISFALLEKAKSIYPESKLVEFHYIARHGASAERTYREHAKAIVMKKFGISVSKHAAKVLRPLRDLHDLYLISTMLDAIHKNQTDQDHKTALLIATALHRKYGANSIIKRNYARALEFSHKAPPEEVLRIYQQAIFCADADSVSVSWYAITLKEAGRLVDAVEVLLFACMLNSDDATNFARLAYDTSNLIQPTNAFLKAKLKRPIPREFNTDTVVHATLLSETCDDFTKEEKDLCVRALKNVGVDNEQRADFYKQIYLQGDISRPERSAFVERLYNAIKTKTTDLALFEGGGE